MTAALLLLLPYITPLLAGSSIGFLVPFMTPTNISRAIKCIRILSSAKLPPLTTEERNFLRKHRSERSDSDLVHGRR